MKVIKTASGKKQIKISKNEWESIGKKAGWMKVAECECRECGCKCSEEDCMSEAGVWKGCPECGSKNVNKNASANKKVTTAKKCTCKKNKDGECICVKDCDCGCEDCKCCK